MLENGGGNTTSEVLRKCVSQDMVPSFCIVDSDMKYGPTDKYPEPKKGQTVQKVMHVVRELGELPWYGVFPLSIHEIENLVPLCVLNSLPHDAIRRNGVNRLKSLLDNSKGEAILYYDFKKGYPKMKDAPMRYFWGKIAHQIGYTDADLPPEVEDGKISADDLLFPPVLTGISLDKASKYISNHGFSIKLDDYLVNIWNMLGRFLIAWGCVAEPILA